MSLSLISAPRQSYLDSQTLAALPDAEFELLLPHLKPIRLAFNENIYVYGDTVQHVYFPIDCVVSNLAVMEDGATVEVSMVGRDALLGISAIIGSSRAHHWTRTLIAGSAWKMEAAALRKLFSRHEAVQRAVLRAYRLMIEQVSQRAVCHARHVVMQRLCCWLLMIHDRVGRDDFELTHETIASRIGVRRAGITQAANMLKSMEVVSYRRGHVHIIDRSEIERSACECYETFSREFYGSEIAGHEGKRQKSVRGQ
jgi:CRP-like cAMP-binding protein